MDVIVELSEGNPGAAVVLGHILNTTKVIDPDNALGGLGVLLRLDSLEIYGPRIWMLYKDVCKEDIAKFLAVIRAEQLGQLFHEHLNEAIDGKHVLDVGKIVTNVRNELPNFNARAIQ